MSFFGINGAEFIVLAIVGLIVLGQHRVAQALLWLQDAIDKLRQWSAKLREESSRLREESSLGEAGRTVGDLSDAFASLNPAQLDPRKVIRDAVAEEMKLWMNQSAPRSEKIDHDSQR